MKFSSKLFATTAITVFFAGAVAAQETVKRTDVLATVNGTEITVGHVVSLASRLPEQYMAVENKELFKGIVEQLVNQELLSASAEKDTVDLLLARENETRALYAVAAIEALYDKALTDEAVTAQYKKLYQDADPIPEYNASHILVKTEDEAKALVAELADGKEFAELAKEKSKGPSGPQGGLLGWMGLGQTVPEFEGAMIALKPGEQSKPVKTQFGWHVILLNEIRDQPAPELEAVRGEIEEGLKSTALEAHMLELEASAEIERNDSKFDPDTVKKFELLEK